MNRPSIKSQDWNEIIQNIKWTECDDIALLLSPIFFKELHTLRGQNILVVECKHTDESDAVLEGLKNRLSNELLPYLTQEPWCFDDLIIRFA